MRLCFLFLLLTLFVGAEESWPERHDTPAPTLQRLPDKDEATVWATHNLVLVCEVELPRPQLENIARVIESVPQLLQRLPIPLWAPPATKKAVVRICRNEVNFAARGGPPEAAGCYQSRREEIIIRGDLLLNPPQRQAKRLRPGPDETLLIHETTHLAMHQYGGRIPPWLSEGLAEYFAACHLGKGSYDFTQGPRLIRQRIRSFYPEKAFPQIALPNISILDRQSPRAWLHWAETAAPIERYRSYACSLLLTHYYLSSNDRRKLLKDYLQECKQLSPRRQRRAFITEATELEKKLSAYWRTQALPLTFPVAKE